MPGRIRGRQVDSFIVDEMPYLFREPRVALTVVEKNGRWHVYETTTEPWALVTAFSSEEQARAYAGFGIHAGPVEVKVEGWVEETLQEDRKCIVCDKRLYGGSKVQVRSIRVISDGLKTKTKYEAKCLEHTRNRFNRDDPL